MLEHDVSEALFEGLFARAVPRSTTLEVELRRLGYDLQHPLAGYPGPVFSACLEAARVELFPTRPPDEGQRALGLAFVNGFRETILGRVVTTALPILGPARFFPRLPGRLASLRRDASVVVEVKEHAATLTFTDPLPVAHFFAGVIEGALGLARASAPRVVVVVLPNGYRLEASWA